MNPRTPVAVAATLVALALAGCSADPEPTAADRGTDEHVRKHHGPKTGDSKDDGSRPASGSPAVDTSSDTDTDTDTDTVPAYWVGDSPQGPRLFREFRTVAGGDPLGEAADLLTSGSPLDGDYRSPLAGVDLGDVSYSDGAGAIIVQLHDDSASSRPAGMSRRTARLATQQLVYTLQGVQQARVPVLVQQGAEAVPLLGVDTTGGLTRAEPWGTLNLVSITSPEQGATVSDTFTATGVASSFEATVPWEIRSGSTVVKRGFTTADGWMDKLYPWEAEVDVSDLEPGDYTFVALTDDPSGGETGGPQWDSKEITVR